MDNTEAIDFTSDTDKFDDKYRRMIDVHIEYVTGVRVDRPSYWSKELFSDPDTESKMLNRLHKVLWLERALPTGKLMHLGKWSSDTIFSNFIGYDKEMKNIFKQVVDLKGKDIYRKYVEKYTKDFYCNIGSFIIFPISEEKPTINQARGNNNFICDRFDLTLECIRKYYAGQKSPLYETLKRNETFFSLFGNFKNYVDFFFLQDLVSDDYSCVKFWLGDGSLKNVKFWINDENFTESPLPNNVEEYFQLIDKQLAFVKKRTARIKQAMPDVQSK